MCSNCDYKRYEKIDEETIGKSLGFGDMEIHCDARGQNYKIVLRDNKRSFINIYHCPTCGNKLY